MAACFYNGRMLILIAPTKTLRFIEYSHIATEALFGAATAAVATRLKGLTEDEHKKLGKLSDALASQTYNEYGAWGTAAAPSHAALYAYAGTVFERMNPVDFDADDVAFAQERLRIIDALYGLLRPLDAIQPYRLEMQAKLAVDGFKNLHSFWREKVTTVVNEAAQDCTAIINLTSAEYLKAIDCKKLQRPLITPHFKEEADGALKTRGMYAKQARGEMVRFCIKNRLEHPEHLKEFSVDGYRFDAEYSSEEEYVFVR